jgi:hypothetical protein
MDARTEQRSQTAGFLPKMVAQRDEADLSTQRRLSSLSLWPLTCTDLPSDRHVHFYGTMAPRKSSRRSAVQTASAPESEPEPLHNGDAAAGVSEEGGAESAASVQGIAENGPGSMTMEERMAKMQALRKKKVRFGWPIFLSYGVRSFSISDPPFASPSQSRPIAKISSATPIAVRLPTERTRGWSARGRSLKPWARNSRQRRQARIWSVSAIGSIP